MTAPLIFGHRGAPSVLPENTLAGFQHAIDAGADGLELDVLLTGDHTPVVTHNPRLLADTTRDAGGRWLPQEGPALASLTLEELQAYDVGAIQPGSAYDRKHPDQQAQGFTPIPTLDAFLALVAAQPRRIELLIELKHDPDAQDAPSFEQFVSLVEACVRKHGLIEQSYVHAFHWGILSAAAKVAPNWRRSHLSISRKNDPDGTLYEGSPWMDGVSADPDHMLQDLVARGAKVWSPYYKDLTSEMLRKAQDMGLKVMTWTVNGTENLTSDIEKGVDGLISDMPGPAVLLRDGQR